MLIMWKKWSKSNYKIINATYFKETLYGNGETYKNRARRLKEVQNIALRIARKNPKITEIELVEEITNIIEIDINTTKQTQTTNKQLTRKWLKTKKNILPKQSIICFFIYTITIIKKLKLAKTL